MSRKSPKSITLPSHVRCERIYPTEKTRRTIDNLKTIGILLNKQQAIDLATLLLAAAQQWDKIDIKGDRFNKRQSDNTYTLTVTSQQPDEINLDLEDLEL
jgi:hypothetical protein